MNGDQWTARLSEYIDGELPPNEHQALERHLVECADCRETAAQLRRVTIRSGALEDRPPRADLWPGIAKRIGVAARDGNEVRMLRRRWAFTIPQLAAAGFALMVVGASSVWLATAGDSDVGGPGSAPALTVSHAGFASGATYDAAIADLERVLAENRDRLDTATVRVLEQSLLLVNRAIERAQTALARDPSDTYLNTHLAETMRSKLNLLRRAADVAAVSL